LQMYKMEHAHDPTSRNMGTASFWSMLMERLIHLVIK
jgi:hypothetical protein